MGKRMISCLICCLMLIGMLPLTIVTKAQTNITSLNFTINDFELGNQAQDVTLTLATENEDEIYWNTRFSTSFAICTEIGDFNKVYDSLISESATLEKDTTYYIAIQINPKQGYSADELKAENIYFSLSNKTLTAKEIYPLVPGDVQIHTYIAVVEMPAFYTEVVIPFQKTVKVNGNKNPGAQNFSLDVFEVGYGNEEDYTDVTVNSLVQTENEGTFDGTLTISGPVNQVDNFLCEGFMVREKNENVTGWSYSDNVWYVAYINPDDRSSSNNVAIFYKVYTHTGEEEGYEIDFTQSYDTMTFENVYTVNEETKATATPTSGWDDGGPFTTDTCGNVFDRWGNKIYEANGCNVSRYNLVRTSVKD